MALVLVLAGPPLRRLAFRERRLVTLAVLCGFALVTRFEPSVLRASAMAAVGVTASCLGRQADGLRVLALAVTGLLLVDPFLSVGLELLHLGEHPYPFWRPSGSHAAAWNGTLPNTFSLLARRPGG